MAEPSLKSLSKDVPQSLDALNIIQSISRHSDREAAIVGASLLEHSLRLLLEKTFCPLTSDQTNRMFDGSAPLGSFSARIDIAYALSIIDRTVKSDLDLVRQVRNAFAHTVKPLYFHTPAVAEFCNRMRAPEVFYEYKPPGGAVLAPKTRFTLTVEALWFFIQGPMTGSKIRGVTRPEPSPEMPAE